MANGCPLLTPRSSFSSASPTLQSLFLEWPGRLKGTRDTTGFLKRDGVGGMQVPGPRWQHWDSVASVSPSSGECRRSLLLASRA